MCTSKWLKKLPGRSSRIKRFRTSNGGVSHLKLCSRPPMYWGVSQFDWGVSHSTHPGVPPILAPGSSPAARPPACPSLFSKSLFFSPHGARRQRPGSARISAGMLGRPAFRPEYTLHFGRDLPCISTGARPASRPGSALRIRPRRQVPPAVVLGRFAVYIGEFRSPPAPVLAQFRHVFEQFRHFFLRPAGAYFLGSEP